jgi:hypothetical protein
MKTQRKQLTKKKLMKKNEKNHFFLFPLFPIIKKIHRLYKAMGEGSMHHGTCKTQWILILTLTI